MITVLLFITLSTAIITRTIILDRKEYFDHYGRQ